ncbi:hypothetical protein CNBG_1055 [Cryptococcus deuterogattii R265]|uniref:Uncharacterized protein n=1 Tax=Cryptococcus deuterogattii (strain R265) TaxID=294750 RepID=A0A095C3Q2_CRYD2|nr:hypothetical protein CNBG_1055 [Cryptococcus deuterogattii R265]KIR75343.1 hypothetical protein I310_00030 [Cryptococcus deuterogattii CA1014]
MPAAAPIILGTIALIGTGYMFKKFVYDPHLASYIESAWETSWSSAEAVADKIRMPSVHHLHRHRQGHRYERVEEEEGEEVEGKAIAMPVIGTSTAIVSPGGGEWGGKGKSLRRRGSKKAGNEEREVGLEFKPGNPLYELPSSSLSPPSPNMAGNPFKTSRTPTPITAAVSVSATKGWQTPEYAVTRPDSAQDAEVRSVIFNVPSTFSPSAPSLSPPSWSNSHAPVRLSSPTSVVGVSSPNEERGSFGSPSHFSPVNGSGFVPAPSTTFSFLSLSQQSSPRYIPQAFNEFTFDRDDRMSERAATGYAQSPRMIREGGGAREDDVISLAETSTTGFEDAEAYSPMPLSRTLSGSSGSLGSQAGNPFNMPSIAAGDDAFIDTLGLTYVMPPLSSHVHANKPSSHPYPQRRGPMSVVSVSGSEADEGRTDSEWEAVGSEYGR